MANWRVDTTVEHEFSNNTMITGSSFVTLGEGGVFQAHTHFPIIRGSIGVHKLAKVMAPGALHNSAERYDPPKCHPKTREVVIKKIMDWVQGLGELERHCCFMWLYGPAGAGKSAIAQTIAELCHDLKLLAASFFFSRTAAGRNDHSHLIATLTYQLCLSIPEIRTDVEDALELDPNVFSLSLETQVRKLIIEPLSHFHNNGYHRHTHPKLFIIDGLDECASAIYVQRQVLQVLAEQLPIPMFFIVASRPEPHIRGFFTAEPMASIKTTLSLDGSYLPDADIKVFLEARFDDIKRDHPLSHQLPDPWPSAVDVDHLVRESSGQFIYASTVMKYIESHHHRPTNRLEMIMNHGKHTPLTDIDALYTQIFSSIKVKDIDKVLEVFGVLLFVNIPNFPKSLALIEALLDLPSGDSNRLLNELHSILDFQAQGRTVEILHASLGDFLLDQRRAGIYHIIPGYAHANLARHFMRCITQKVTDDETFILNKFSSDFFTKHCTRSYPTAELLNALWSVEPSHFWRFLYSVRPINPDGLSDFITWLKNNGSTKGGQHLYSYYMLGWALYIQDSLTDSPLEPSDSQFIIFCILPQFHRKYDEEDWHIFSRKRDSPPARFLDSRDSRHDLLLMKFFSDPHRSGPFHLDGDKYATFSIKFTNYLITASAGPSTAMFYVQLGDHLYYLSVLLSMASYLTELATLLNSKLLNVIKDHWHRPDLLCNADKIVKDYCDTFSARYCAVPHTDTFTSGGMLIPSTPDSSTVTITQYKQARQSPEENRDTKRPLSSTWNMEPLSAVTPISASQYITTTLHPISALSPNDHVNELDIPLAPPNEYVGLMDMALLPVPLGGFPAIQGLTDMDMRACVSSKILAVWERYQGSAVLAYIPHNQPEAESSPTAMKIRNLIQSVFNVPELVVSVPQYIDTRDLVNKPIHPFFIGGISNVQAQVLLERICWSTPTITFFTAQFTPFVSDFVMTLQNIPLASTHDNDLVAIANALKCTIRTLSDWITRHHDALPDHHTIEEAIECIVDSVRVTSLDTIVAGEPVTLFNIFATSPSRDSAIYKDWVNQLRNITYFSRCGAHTSREPFSCDCCRSTVHPIEHCPFQAILGFPPHPSVVEPNSKNRLARRGRK